MSVSKVVVHTDLFLDHLTGRTAPSRLRRAVGNYFCYTTVFHAIELFSLARTEKEARAVEDAMAAVKLLGLNPKNARRYGRLLSGATRTTPWNVLIAGLCLESRLPLLTDRADDFVGINGLTILPTSVLSRQ